MENQSIAKFQRWMRYYLNGKYTNRFEHGFMNRIEIVRPHTIETYIDRIKTVNHNVPDSKNFIHNNNKIIKLYQQQLKNAAPTDLIVHSTHARTIHQEVCHVLNSRDLEPLGEKLNIFLHRLPIAFKIKWILKHKKLSDGKFAKKVHMYQQQITDFRDGKRNIMNMTLQSAVNICDYYNRVIDTNLPIPF